MKEGTLVSLDGLREECGLKSRAIRERLAKVQKAIGKEHEGLLKAMREHEKAWVARLEKAASMALTAPSPSVEVAPEHKDVWLSELTLHNQVESFLAEKRRFCAVLKELYAETRMLNADCSRKLSQIMAEYFTVKAKQSLAQVEQMKDVSRAVDAIEPESEWTAALIKARLDYEWVLEAPPIDGFTHSVLNQISCEILGTVSSHESRGNASPLARAPSSSLAVRPVRILKAGYLMRPGSTFGPAWSVLFWVLTDSHFLHAFLPETRKRRRRSVDKASPDPSYHVPTPDEQLGKKHLSELNGAIATAWLGFMAQEEPGGGNWLRVDARLLEPVLSIPLFDGVAVSVESPNEHIWSILVPGMSGFFGQRTDKKYSFRSFVEEDMVDWCIALKDAIAAAQAASSSFMGEPPRSRPAEATAQPHWKPPADEGGPYMTVTSPFEEDDEPVLNISGLSLGTEPSRHAFSLDNPWDH